MVEMSMMMRLAALTVSCVSALVAHGRPAQAPCGAIDPNGRPTAATRSTHSRPTREATGWPLGASLPHNAALSPTHSRGTTPMAKCAQRSAH